MAQVTLEFYDAQGVALRQISLEIPLSTIEDQGAMNTFAEASQPLFPEGYASLKTVGIVPTKEELRHSKVCNARNGISATDALALMAMFDRDEPTAFSPRPRGNGFLGRLSSQLFG